MNTPRAKKLMGSWRALLGPLMLAHFVAYPLSFASALASMPLAMLVRKRALLAAGNEGATNSFLKEVAQDLSLGPIEAAQLEIVLGFALWVSLVVGLAVHLSALPWAFCARKAAVQPDLGKVFGNDAQRAFGWLVAALLALVFVVGGVGWIWVLTL